MAYKGEEEEDRSYSDDSYHSYSRSASSRSSYSVYSTDEEEEEEGREGVSERFFVTKESQENISEPSRKYSYAGMRDLTDLGKVQEQDIVAADGSVRGVKNRVRAGLANFENKEALEKVHRLQKKGGGADFAGNLMICMPI